jgi:hypothetical protein
MALQNDDICYAIISSKSGYAPIWCQQQASLMGRAVERTANVFFWVSTIFNSAFIHFCISDMHFWAIESPSPSF